MVPAHVPGPIGKMVLTECKLLPNLPRTRQGRRRNSCSLSASPVPSHQRMYSHVVRRLILGPGHTGTKSAARFWNVSGARLGVPQLCANVEKMNLVHRSHGRGTVKRQLKPTEIHEHALIRCRYVEQHTLSPRRRAIDGAVRPRVCKHVVFQHAVQRYRAICPVRDAGIAEPPADIVRPAAILHCHAGTVVCSLWVARGIVNVCPIIRDGIVFPKVERIRAFAFWVSSTIEVKDLVDAVWPKCATFERGNEVGLRQIIVLDWKVPVKAGAVAEVFVS
jgi:hypothetical protein